MPSDDEDLDELIAQITVDAYGDEGYWSFLQAFEDEVTFPFHRVARRDARQRHGHRLRR